MGSIININNDIKNLSGGNTNQILIFGGCFKMRESLDTCYYLGQYHSNHIDTRAILPRYEGSCMIIRAEWYQIKISSSTYTLLA